MAEEQYKISSGIRKRGTRSARLQSAAIVRPARHVGGGDLVVRRGCSTVVGLSTLQKHMAELQQGVADGRFEIRTLAGQLVDLATLTSAPVPVAPPKPIVRPDSAANDKTFAKGVGELVPQYQDGYALTQKVDSPAITVDVATSDGEPALDGVSDPVAERKRRRGYKKDE